MEIFKLRYPFATEERLQQPVVLAMGFFDGVHLGHQKVLEHARREAQKKQVPLAVLTYDHHPQIVFQKIPEQYQYLGAIERKYELLESAGVDIVYEVSFTSKLAHLAPQAFVDEVLVQMSPITVVAGIDHTYGPREIANMTLLPQYADDKFKVIAVSQLEREANKVGSSAIRNLLMAGDVDGANELLGYHYRTTGLVVHGQALGRTLGFPTANVLTPNSQLLPGVGVYGVRIKIADKWYDADASVGHNQTIGDNLPKTLEVYIFDFHEEIYGENVEVEWYHHVRDMEKLDGLETLIKRLKQDEIEVRNFFAKK